MLTNERAKTENSQQGANDVSISQMEKSRVGQGAEMSHTTNYNRVQGHEKTASGGNKEP